MSKITSQLLAGLQLSLPQHIITASAESIVIYPNALQFGHNVGGTYKVTAQNQYVTIAYCNAQKACISQLVWGKDFFACIPGISLALNDNVFTASVTMQSPQQINQAQLQEIVRICSSFVVKGDKVLDKIADARVSEQRYHQMILEMSTANYFLQTSEKDNLNKQFDAIYSVNSWGVGSGFGSLPQFTTGYREFLQNFIAEHDIKTIADVGCGDWQFSRLMDFSKVQYTGYDVASKVVARNQELYSTDNIKFVLYDGDFERVAPADLLICKDVLQHLPNDYVQRFLQILPKFKYALISNSISEAHPENNNVDLPVAGGFRTLDLTKPPFNLKAKQVYKIDRSSVNVDSIVVLLYSRDEQQDSGKA